MITHLKVCFLFYVDWRDEEYRQVYNDYTKFFRQATSPYLYEYNPNSDLQVNPPWSYHGAVCKFFSNDSFLTTTLKCCYFVMCKYIIIYYLGLGIIQPLKTGISWPSTSSSRLSVEV